MATGEPSPNLPPNILKLIFDHPRADNLVQSLNSVISHGDRFSAVQYLFLLFQNSLNLTGSNFPSPQLIQFLQNLRSITINIAIRPDFWNLMIQALSTGSFFEFSPIQFSEPPSPKFSPGPYQPNFENFIDRIIFILSIDQLGEFLSARRFPHLPQPDLTPEQNIVIRKTLIAIAALRSYAAPLRAHGIFFLSLHFSGDLFAKFLVFSDSE